VLLIKDPTPIRFDAFVCGEASIQVDGVMVLQGRGEQEATLIPASTSLERGPGVYQIRLQFRSLANRAARLQIWWQGPSFAREPLPAWQLGHLDADAPPALAREQEIARGREAASPQVAVLAVTKAVFPELPTRRRAPSSCSRRC
jgi:hypothetical protein